MKRAETWYIRSVYQELCLGVVDPNSRLQYQQIMADLVTQGAESYYF